MEGDDELAALKRMLGQTEYTDMAPQAWKDAGMGRMGGPKMEDRIPPPRNQIAEDSGAAWEQDLDEMETSLSMEANPDGTISDDEDEEREMLLADFEAELDELLSRVMDGATEIGGQFRNAGIVAEVRYMLEIKARSLSSSTNADSDKWNQWTP